MLPELLCCALYLNLVGLLRENVRPSHAMEVQFVRLGRSRLMIAGLLAGARPMLVCFLLVSCSCIVNLRVHQFIQIRQYGSKNLKIITDAD